jgi:hypothetical protein
VLASIHPFVLAAAIGAVAAMAALVVALTVRSKALATMAGVAALVLLLPAAYVFVSFNPWLVDARFRTYRAFYRDIREGMTRDEVLAALERRYPGTGARQPPKIMEDSPERLGFFMNPETSREPNCEGIFLQFEHGRVIGKSYSPD